MAKYALTAAVAASASTITMPTSKDSFIRIENLGDPDTAGDIWIALVDTDEVGDPLTVTVEGDECVRVRPGTSQLFRYRSAYQCITSSGDIDALFQSSNGLE